MLAWSVGFLVKNGTWKGETCGQLEKISASLEALGVAQVASAQQAWGQVPYPLPGPPGVGVPSLRRC